MTPREREQALLAVLFTDIVGSSELAAELGDQPWRRLLRRHHEIMRAAVGRGRGRIVDTAGDGVFAVFDRPAAAIRCAFEAIDALREIGIEIRAGIHFGETESSEGRVSGIVVHTAARVMALAGPGEILVTRTVGDLVAGKRISVTDRGTHELKGIPSRWDVFAVEEVEGRPRTSPAGAEAARALRAGSAEPADPRRPPLPIVLAGVAAVIVATVVVALAVEREDPVEPVVASPTLVRIDQETREREEAAIGDGVTAIAVGEGSVWLASFGDRSVYRVDPETLQAVRISMREPPLAIAVGAGGVWVTTATTLVRVDPTTEAVGDPITLGTCGQTTCPTDVAVTDAQVWATQYDSEGLVTLDPARDGSERQIDLASWPVAMAVGHGAVWILHEDQPLRFLVERIDIGTEEQAFGTLPPQAHERIGCLEDEVGSGAEPCADIAVGARAVWVTTPGDDVSFLWRLDPDDGHRTGAGVEVECCAMAMVTTSDLIDAIWIGRSSGDVIQVPEVEGVPRDDVLTVGEPVTDLAVGYGAMWVTVDALPT